MKHKMGRIYLSFCLSGFGQVQTNVNIGITTLGNLAGMLKVGSTHVSSNINAFYPQPTGATHENTMLAMYHRLGYSVSSYSICE